MELNSSLCFITSYLKSLAIEIDESHISYYLPMRMLYTRRYHISSVFAFTCGPLKTIQIRYVWTRNFSKMKKNTSVFKNIPIRVDKASLLTNTAYSMKFEIHNSQICNMSAKNMGIIIVLNKINTSIPCGITNKVFSMTVFIFVRKTTVISMSLLSLILYI